MLFVFIYIAAIVSANLLVAQFGPAVTPINAFMLIGLDLALRDHLHDKWLGKNLWPKMLGLIATAGAISYSLNPAAGIIAVASTVSFCVSGVVDAMAYHTLRHRPYLHRSNGSNVAGAIADSLLFPTIAFGGLMPSIVAAQFIAKVVGGFVWSLALAKSSKATA